MGLFQAACQTYDAQAHRAGVEEEGRQTLVPVSHMMMNAQIEIILSDDGKFVSARAVPKEENKTIIPATIDSSTRTQTNTKAHPLCDQLRYVAPYCEDKFAAYYAFIKRWAESEFSHPKVRAIQRYISSRSILHDLAEAQVIYLGDDGLPTGGKIEGTEYGNCVVRWVVIPSPDGVPAECFRDTTLMKSFTDYYAKECGEQGFGLCTVSGNTDRLCTKHPKNIVITGSGAKLISANDDSGFTYRGRFSEAEQACSIGYEASQKAHNALRWLAANFGVIKGNRTFICWNPQGRPVPTFQFDGIPVSEEKEVVSYKQALSQTLSSYRNRLKPEADVIITALEPATTGRLSVTYYNELRGSDYLDRIESWYYSCCILGKYGEETPSIKSIVACAFGTQRNNFLEVDDKIVAGHTQRLLRCIIDGQPIPMDILKALVTRANMTPECNNDTREYIVKTTCAVLRKYRNDRANKEEWKLSLDKNNSDRSYLFGRFLAVADAAERNTYNNNEDRETNAIKMQAVFSQRPMYAARIINEQLKPYLEHMKPGYRRYYKDIISEIFDRLYASDCDLNKKLDDIYILGFYHQRADLYTAKNKAGSETAEDTNDKITENNYTEEN